MLQHRIEAKWIRYFEVAFALCGVKAGDAARAVARAVMAGVPESSYRAALNATPAVMRTMAQRIPGAHSIACRASVTWTIWNSRTVSILPCWPFCNSIFLPEESRHAL